MKILLVSVKGDGAWFVHLLEKEGHDVDWVCASDKDASTLSGLIPPPLAKAPNPSKYDLVVFDSSGLGEAADDARKVTPTIGGSALADRLEDDRVFGLETMERAGIKVPRWEAFSSPREAVTFLQKNNKRYVLKPIGDDLPSDQTYVSKSAPDMIRFIETRLDAKVKSFVLQEFVEGIEVSTEAWWTGNEWVALNHTLEEKKLMSGGVGPNTGCAGNVVWMPARKNPIFQQGLEKMGPLLKEAGYVGMVDLNTIATEGDVWGLEWTPRFGYEGTCNLTRLLPIGFGDFLFNIAIGRAPTLSEPRAKFAATLRLSVPPYPSAEFSRRKVRVPIRGVDLDHLESFVLYDVSKQGFELITGGTYNVIGSPIGAGGSIKEAFDAVEQCIKSLDIPDLQYRNDCCACIERRYAQLQSWGWLRPLG
jgi:phosphoribosylamine-glycine ligase